MCYTAFSNGEFGCFSQIQPFDIPVKVLTQRWSRVRSKAFNGRRTLYYSNTTGITQFELLKLSGNIELNPGPSRCDEQTIKTHCAGCSNVIRANYTGIPCTSCLNTYHGKCTNMNRKELRNYRMVSQDTSWYCTVCSLPPFSDSLFDETLHSANDSSLNSSSNGLKDINDSFDWFTSAVCGYYKSNIKMAYLLYKFYSK